MTCLIANARIAALAALVLVSSASLSAAQNVPNTVVKSFSSGAGIGAVGMVDASEDTEVDGPQAIYTGQDGNVYLLDQVNGRVLQFDPRNTDAETRSFELPADLQPTDMVVTRNHIMVWDGDIHALKPSGPDDAPTRGLDEISTRDIVEDEFAVSAFAQMGSQKPDTSDDVLDENTRAIKIPKRTARTRQAVASRGQGPVIVDVTAASPTVATMEVRRKDEKALLAKLRIEVRDRLGATEFLEIDSAGRMYVLVENIPPSGRKSAAAFVARFTPQGRLESIYDLPLSQSIAPSRRFVTVSADGDVFFLRTRKGEVDVLGVGSRGVGKVAIIDSPAGIPSSFEFPTLDKKGKFIAAVRPLTRQQVVQTAFAFEGVQWKVSQSAYGQDPDMACTGFRRIRRPGYLIGKLGQEVRGIPYCWGCHGSLAAIGAKIASGARAGNVCTRNEPQRDLAGVDCSAFVSAAWGLAQHFTTVAIPSITTQLTNAWDLQPGDALNKPGSHVMLFLRFTPDRKAEVMEASPGACNGRVCRNVYPLSALLARGYSPVRFRSLTDEAQAKIAEASAKAAAAEAAKPAAKAARPAAKQVRPVRVIKRAPVVRSRARR